MLCLTVVVLGSRCLAFVSFSLPQKSASYQSRHTASFVQRCDNAIPSGSNDERSRIQEIRIVEHFYPLPTPFFHTS